MRTLKPLTLLLALCFYVPAVLAADAAINISKPVGGTIFSPTSKIDISYAATPGPKGDHVHLVVDDQKPIVVHQLKGGHTIDPLAPGKHGICARIVDKDHAEIGVQDCVMFRVE